MLHTSGYTYPYIPEVAVNNNTLFQDIISALAGDTTLMGIDIDAAREKLSPHEDLKRGLDCVVSFLDALGGHTHAGADSDAKPSRPAEWRVVEDFFTTGISLVLQEVRCRLDEDPDFANTMAQLHAEITPGEYGADRVARLFRRLFFPEAYFDPGHKDSEISSLRKKREVTITRVNKHPVTSPASEIIFTSNALLTVPAAGTDPGSLGLSESIKSVVPKIMEEEQRYWYDHPVQLGTLPEHNEVIYGLKGLEEALAYEEKTGMKDPAIPATCLLSVSVTHEGLHRVARRYLQDELQAHANLKRLSVYVFTEDDTRRILEDVLLPACREMLGTDDTTMLNEVFGVDGKYGRHYSFLKAITAFWQVLVEPRTRGTFKIDLDQVFPQEQLVAETGRSAFSHLATPLWGADGIDTSGNRVHLGLIAGALVNEKDIVNGLFTPDVSFPSDDNYGESLFFYSSLPQALSTEAEMMTRYTGQAEPDGETSCIQRIHVTGGTNGILVDSLRKYRPFTPGFIARAEDQAYILSTLFNDENGGYLRYLHRDGFFMRHDKEAFAGDAIKAAKMGKMIGDYERILLFTHYCRALPWSVEKVKDVIDPFTGSFVSRMPFTVIYMRLALKALALLDSEHPNEGVVFLQQGGARLLPLLREFSSDANPLKEHVARERQGWDLYYDVLDAIENELYEKDDLALALKKKTLSIIEDCRIKTGS